MKTNVILASEIKSSKTLLLREILL